MELKSYFSIDLTEGLAPWLTAATYLLPVSFFLAGLFLGKSVGPENTRLFLSTLAGSQAGVIAIVFSVMIIGIQLTASRYSSRMIPLFTKSRIFFHTFLVFAISIGLDLWLLYNVPSMPSPYYTGLIYMSGGWAITAALSLLVFVFTAFNRNTPEGILSAFEDKTSSDKYFSEVKNQADNEDGVHPLYPLRSMFMSSLSEGRRSTAEQTLDKYSKLSKEILKEFKDQNLFSEEQAICNGLYGPVLTEHLKEMAFHAQEMSESKMVQDISKLQKEIGIIGLELNDNNLVSRQACRGLSTCIRKSNRPTGNYLVNGSSWRRLGEFLRVASNPSSSEGTDEIKPEAVKEALFYIDKRAQSQVSHPEIPRRQLRSTFTSVLGDLKISHRPLLDEYGETICKHDIEWSEEFVDENHPEADVLKIFERWRKAVIDITRKSVRYFVENGKYPITEGNFRSDLKEMCIDASGVTSGSYTVTLCQLMIEAAFITSLVDESEATHWMHVLARVKWKGDAEVVDKAFENILEYDYKSDAPEVQVLGWDQEDNRDEYYWGLINHSKYSPLNANEEFPDNVRNLQEKVDERVLVLEERSSD